MLLDPELPATIAGKAMLLRAVTPCWNATDTAIHGLIISTFREDATAQAVDVVEQEDPDDHIEAICKRYEFATPVDMSGGRRVSIRTQRGCGEHRGHDPHRRRDLRVRPRAVERVPIPSRAWRRVANSGIE